MPKFTTMALAKATGQDKVNPARYGQSVEEVKNPLPADFTPPIQLAQGAKKQYYRLIETALPGTLTLADTEVIAIAAVLLDEFNESPRDFTGAKIGHLRQALGALGRTPADRMKFLKKPDKDSKGNEFDDF